MAPVNHRTQTFAVTVARYPRPVTPSTSVFISRLRGLPVVDAGGDQIGKVRDVVIQVRTQRAPRAKGLVVELFARQRIFVNTARVYSVDAMQVVVSGTINTRRFSRHEAETLVIDDLFDRLRRQA